MYDYVPGTIDQLSFGLPHEGAARLAGDVARRDVPTCAPADPIGRLTRGADGEFCVVVNDAGVVCGLVQDLPPDIDPDAPVSTVMDYGSTTVRPPLLWPSAGLRGYFAYRTPVVVAAFLAELWIIVGRLTLQLVGDVRVSDWWFSAFLVSFFALTAINSLPGLTGKYRRGVACART